MTHSKTNTNKLNNIKKGSAVNLKTKKANSKRIFRFRFGRARQ